MSEQEPLRKLSEIVDVADDKERTRHQLRILDGLLAAAVREKDFKAALEITERAQRMLSRAR